MSNIIETIDYEGNIVICTRTQWYAHIVRGHGMMAPNKEAVSDTIEHPDEVYKDKDYEQRKLFYKATPKATYGAKLNTKVVVEYSEESKGAVVTAFPVKSKGSVGDALYP